MSFPEIKYKATNVELEPMFTDLVEKKFPSLDKYWKDQTPVLCEVEFEKEAKRQSGPIHRVEVNLTVDGTLFRAEATEENFERAIDEVRDELDKELRRAKDKKDTLIRKGGRIGKEILKN